MTGVKNGDERLMGFGHRVYKNYDPRATIIKAAAEDVFEVTGRNPLLDIATELERIALEDDYFVSAQALPERRLLLGAHLRGAGLPVVDVPGDVRDRADAPAGSPSGWSSCRTRSRRSPARARSTRAIAGATTCRSTSAPEGSPRRRRPGRRRARPVPPRAGGRCEIRHRARTRAP